MDTKATYLIGEFQARLDAKGRFLFPAGFRKQLPEEEKTFVLSRGFENCLSLYTLDSWGPMYEELRKLNSYDMEVRRFRRHILNGATYVDLDSAGRILIPKSLIDYADLGKDIVLNSAVDKIEIWNKDVYEKIFESFSPEEFSKLAEKVMVRKEEKE